ncbi:TetR family transcriptional regulator [Pseudonocardia kunmingensis]|uniref:TetR family transcriptional regulator n=1 Tax=Pseudonocardia kunmingensis TaxID=630975 RepID=A0A543D3P8_9PSEU|nr:TetR family transcriptional regulator [Pseudonocardia kunmingensis]TQM03951.1 TetR family transcriptional regulator [Pseudonocardia kunmingensis]
MGLRERKKQATRAALSWAAVRLAVERGFDEVRVEDIAAAVDVSPRTFNNYFSSKAEAIAARQLERARAIADALRARPAGEPLWPSITEAVVERYALGQHDDGPDPRWVAGVRLMMGEPALQGEVLKATAAAATELAAAVGERTGTDARDMYPRLVAGAVLAAAQVCTDQWLHADPPVQMAPLLRAALGQLAAGLPVPR